MLRENAVRRTVARACGLAVSMTGALPSVVAVTGGPAFDPRRPICARPCVRGRKQMLICAVLAFASLSASQSAWGARSATGREATRIHRLVLPACNADQRQLAHGKPCRAIHRPKVSTVDPRYAFAYVTGEGWSGELVKRTTPHSTRWRIVAISGNGVNSCSYWASRSSIRVVVDLHLLGERGYCTLTGN